VRRPSAGGGTKLQQDEADECGVVQHGGVAEVAETETGRNAVL
jgi:hypothetical protein